MTSNWLSHVLFRKTSISKHDMNALGSLSSSHEQVELLNTRLLSFKPSTSENIFNRHILRLCEEILLNPDLNHTYLSIAGDFLMFAHCDTPLRQFTKQNSACAVFPLLDEPPSFSHLWVFEDHDDILSNDHLLELQAGKEIKASFPSLKVFVIPDTEFIGNSWKLAFHMARKALQDKQLRKKLALEWIVSGDVDSEEQIKKVQLGNKLDLATERNWLLPRANYRDSSSNWQTKGIV